LKNIEYREALREALIEEMDRDKSVYIIGEDVGVYGGSFKVTKDLIDKYGVKRVVDTPISEAAIIGTAVGSSFMGLRPVAEISFIDFSTLAMDQIVNQAAKIRFFTPGKFKTPVVIRTQGGIGGGIGGQHSQSLEAWYVHIPGLKVVMPSTPYDAKGLLKTAIRDDEPVIFIENKRLYQIKGEIPEEEYLIPFKKADIKRQGNDITIIATSYMVHESLEAAQELEKEGIDLEIIDPRTLVPLDIDTIINSIKKTSRALIVHEGYERGGIGAEISAVINERVFDFLDTPVQRLGGANAVIPYSYHLEKACIPGKDDIIEKVKNILNS
jgi:pyruvate/2-oxoglutarate/acetoin dehydrogenase E1 component